MGFWTVFANAAYAYSSVETISMAAAETYAPRRNIPKAAKRVFVRVLLFYGKFFSSLKDQDTGYDNSSFGKVISIFMITLLVPSDDPMLLRSTGTAAQSPFLIAATRAGIPVVPHIINAIVLTSAWSSANSSLLFNSASLHTLR